MELVECHFWLTVGLESSLSTTVQFDGVFASRFSREHIVLVQECSRSKQSIAGKSTDTVNVEKN